MRYNSFRPGRIWLDTEGKRIQAHGGSIMQVDGVFYWYGENKEKTFRHSRERDKGKSGRSQSEILERRRCRLGRR